MKHHLIAAGIAPALALGLAAPAEAATAYMGGLLGTTPGYSTITGPNGERVNTTFTFLGGDERVRWDNVSQASAQRAQIAWLEAHQGEENTLWVYSATANSINAVAAQRPELLANTTVIAIAPPKAAGTVGYSPVPTPSTFRQYQVIVDGDSVADEDGTSFDNHTNGYRNLDLSTAEPISEATVPGTNTTRSYYQRPGTSRSTVVETEVEDEPELSWYDRAKLRAEERRIERAERVAAYREHRDERRAESRARWDRFVSKLRGEDASDSDSPSSARAGASDTASSDSAGGDE